MTVNNVFWLLTGVVLAFAFVRPFRPQRDMYAVETVSILEEGGGSLTDISPLQSDSVVISTHFSITPNGSVYNIRRKGAQQLFGVKSFVVFDDYAAALAEFTSRDTLFLTHPVDGWNGHKVFLWAVSARSRSTVPSILAKGTYTNRKLAETDYSALLKLYRPKLKPTF
jgi:hypothetical protein